MRSPPPNQDRDEPQSVNEVEFLRICGLDNNSSLHIFNLMREEATAGIDRMLLTARSTPGNHQTNGHTILASMLTESAIRNEMIRIFQFADPETKAIYARGNAGNEENWVIRWLLWQEIVRRDGMIGA